MRSNLAHLKDYADFVFQELNVDEMEIMALNYANPPMLDEFYWDIPREVNRRIQDLVEHCIEHKYRLRLPFARMPLRDGSWDGSTGHAAAREIAACQPDADNTGTTNIPMRYGRVTSSVTGRRSKKGTYGVMRCGSPGSAATMVRWWGSARRSTVPFQAAHYRMRRPALDQGGELRELFGIRFWQPEGTVLFRDLQLSNVPGGPAISV